MIKLYCFPRSGNSREVKIVLAEKNIPYESLNIREEAVKNDPEFKKASPKGKVPAIIDNGTYLAEAYDINEYLEKKYPDHAVLPGDAAKRTTIREWVAKYDKSLALKIGLMLIECLLKAKEEQKEETKQKLRTEIEAGLKELDAFLKGKEYFFGEYSLADASMTPHLAALGRVNIEISDATPNLKRWMERIKARPSFEKSAG